MAKLAEMRPVFAAGQAARRAAWPSYSAWKPAATGGFRYAPRERVREFWNMVSMYIAQPGLPDTLTDEDIAADDWQAL